MRISTNQLNTAGLNQILNRQSELSHLQQQIATQKRFLTPSGDPVAATSVLNLESDISLTEQYIKNGEVAASSNELEESVLNSVTEINFRLKELFVQLGNGTYNEQQLDGIKVELQQRYDELIGLANTQNANGDYLFSGFQTKTQPFTLNNSNNVVYNGDQGQRSIRVSSGIKVPVSDSGFSVFENALSGDGVVNTGANAGNTGSGVIEPRSSGTDSLVDDFEIQFTSATTYDIVNTTTATTVVTGATYTDDSDISFNSGNNRFTVAVSGDPLTGDVFSVEPSSRQSIFSTLEQAITAIDGFSTQSNDQANFRSSMIALDGSLGNFQENVDVVRAKIGARLNTIDSELDTNFALKENQQVTLSKLQDLDMVKAASELSRLTTVLEAAQSSFVRIQNLSIFNFIR